MNKSYRLTRRKFSGQTVLAGSLFLASTQLRAAEQVMGPYFEDRGWLIGCWTRPWAGHDYRVGFDAIAEAGFRYVALTGFLEEGMEVRREKLLAKLVEIQYARNDMDFHRGTFRARGDVIEIFPVGLE